MVCSFFNADVYLSDVVTLMKVVLHRSTTFSTYYSEGGRSAPVYHRYEIMVCIVLCSADIVLD